MKSPHLIIKKNLWHYRLFAWSLSVTDRWLGARGTYESRYEFGISVVRYIFTILSLPIILAINVLFYIQLWMAFIVLPFGLDAEYYFIHLIGLVAMVVLLMVVSSKWGDIKYDPGKKVSLTLMLKKTVYGFYNGITPNITFDAGVNNDTS